TDAEHRPLTRNFSMGGEERYSVTISLKAQTQSVSIETVGSKSYLMPVLHFGEVRLKRHIARRIRSVKSDGTAEIEEVNGTASSDDILPPRENMDGKLQASLSSLCSSLAVAVTLYYTEAPSGAQHDIRTTSLLQNLGEDAPPLLALWLWRAVRPSVVFP